MFCTPRYLFLNISWEAGGWNLGFTNQSCRSNLHFSGDPPTFIAITCINMSSTSYQSSFHGDFIGISCRRDTKNPAPPRGAQVSSHGLWCGGQGTATESPVAAGQRAAWNMITDQYCIIIIIVIITMNNNDDNNLLSLYIYIFKQYNFHHYHYYHYHY